jgi:DNA-binding response OmpR family regulator
VPIIAVTALTTKEDLARCLQAGANDFISKPVDSLELRARLQSMLRIKQLYDQLQLLIASQQGKIEFLNKNLFPDHYP